MSIPTRVHQFTTTQQIKPADQSAPPAKTAVGTSLVVVLPALNEQRTIQEVIKQVPHRIPGISQIHIIVIDDGSTDATADKARAVGAQIVQHTVNLGVGAAFQTGIKAALKRGADIIVNIDADGQFNPQDIPTLIKPIQQNYAEFVTASRFADPKLTPRMPKAKLYGNHAMTKIINFLTRRRFTDVSCGFRAYTRDAALRLTLFGHFTYTQETLIDLAFKNITMAEVPLKVRGEREYGRSRVANNLWRYAIKSATIIFRAARDYQPHYFFGLPGLMIFLVGMGSGVFLLLHFLSTGHTYPYRSLVSLSGVFIIVGFLMIFQSMLADMMRRNRYIAEEAVYHARRAAYAQDHEQ